MNIPCLYDILVRNCGCNSVVVAEDNDDDVLCMPVRSINAHALHITGTGVARA